MYHSALNVLVKQVRVVGKFLPSVKRIGLCVVGLNNEYNQNCDSKDYCCDKSPLVKNSVSAGGFILTVEGLGATRDSAGETVLITFLKNNCNNDKCSGYEKQYKKYDFKNFHFLLPFILFLAERV